MSAVAPFLLELDCCVFYIVLIFLSEYSECWSHFIIFLSSQFPITFFSFKLIKGKDSTIDLERIQDQFNSMERKKSC